MWQQDVEWLNDNEDPKNFDDLVRKWKSTAIYRQKSFEEQKNNPSSVNLFKMWPHYKLPRGHQLVSIAKRFYKVLY